MRLRLYPSAAQKVLLLEQCGHARYVWNLGLEQRLMWAQLNRGILKSGWGLLVTRLEQKAPSRVEQVKAAYTSQTCNTCKHIATESRKSQATFVCVACGHTANADVNAARNIAAGHAVTARGDRRVLARSVKREPQQARPPKVA